MTDKTWKLVRDFLLVIFGMFMLAHETLSPTPPDTLIVGAAIGLILGPLPLRIDERRRQRNGEDDG